MPTIFHFWSKKCLLTLLKPLISQKLHNLSQKHKVQVISIRLLELNQLISSNLGVWFQSYEFLKRYATFFSSRRKYYFVFQGFFLVNWLKQTLNSTQHNIKASSYNEFDRTCVLWWCFDCCPYLVGKECNWSSPKKT